MFVRFLMKKPSGAGGSTKSPLELFYDSLWLKPCIKLKSTVSNVSINCNVDYSESCLREESANEIFTEHQVDREEEEEEVVPHEFAVVPSSSYPLPATESGMGKKKQSETDEEFAKSCRARQYKRQISLIVATIFKTR